MGANIYWRTVEKGVPLGVNAPSSFLEIMREAFGRREPFILTSEDVPTLNGIRAAIQSDKEAIDKLIEVIERARVIEVFAQW